MPDAFVVTPPLGPPPLNVVGEQITVLAPGSRIGGYEIFRQAQKAADLHRTDIRGTSPFTWWGETSHSASAAKT